MKNKKLWLAIGCVCLAVAIGLLIWSLTRPAEEKKPEAAEAPAQTEETKDVLARIKERGSLIIAMEGVWQPWTYHDADGKLTGIDVEIGELLAEGLGVKAEFVETAWDGILAGVDSGRFDIACNGVGFTPTRAEAYNFSDSYIYSKMAMVVQADNEDIKALADLKDKKTANSPNSTYALLAEQNGATVTYIAEHPDAKVKVALEVAGEAVAVPMKKGPETESLKAELDRIIAEARKNGKLAEISIKYFGEDLTNPAE